MKNFRLIYFAIAIFLATAATSITIEAQVFSVRATQRQMTALLAQIENKTDRFKQTIDSAIDRTALNNTNREDRIMDLISDFEISTDSLRSRYNSRRSVGQDASDVLNKGLLIDRFMGRNRISASAQTQWAALRNDLNTLATYYRVSWNWTGPVNGLPANPPYIATDSQMRALLTRIETRTDQYKRQMERALDRSRWNNTNSEDSIAMYITEFENSTDRMKQRFDARETVASDASDVLTRALFIDRFMGRNRLNSQVEREWRLLRTDLNTLSNYYRVSWNWNQQLPAYPTYPGNAPYGRFDSRLSGTYRLNTSLSDNVSSVVERSLGYYNNSQRPNVKRNLERRLASPEMLAIEKSGSNVTLASTNSPQATIVADGIARSETNNRGKVISTKVTANNNELSIDYTGDRVNDFFVTFMPTGNDRLKVTRRIYLENRNDMVTVSSVYDKVNNVAQWNVVNDGRGRGNNNGSSNAYYVINGTQLTATLRNEIDTRASHVGDPFTMEVTSPSQYRGAIISGRIAQIEKSSRFSGRANATLDFQAIRMPNGRSYAFAGIVDSVTALNGDTVRVNNEGMIEDGSQTKTTVARAGIGAVLGAIIGAVTGGGEGAAIGAGVGAGAGAGSVLITGRDNIEIQQGSTFRLTATGPANVGYNRP